MRNIKKKNLEIIILIFLFFNFCKNSKALDLLEAINKAKKYDPRFASIFYEYKATLTYPKQARANLFPQINLFYTRGKINYITAPEYYFDYYTYNFRVNFQQSLFDVPNWINYYQNKMKVNMEEEKLTDAELELIKRVSDAYFDLLYAEDYLKVLEEEKKAIQKELQMIKKLYKAGEATKVDINDAEAKYSDILFRLIEAEKNYYSAKNNLENLIGEEPKELAKISEDIKFEEIIPSKVEEWINIAKKNSPILRYHSYAKKIAEKEYYKQLTSALPKIDLVAYYTKSTAVEYIRTAPISYSFVGIQLNLPIFTGGYISAKKQEAYENIIKAKKDYEKVFLNLKQQIVDYFFNIKTALAQIYTGKINLKASQIAFESTKKGYQAGIRTIVDVLNAESNYYKAQLNLIKAKYDYIKNLIGLKYVCGILKYEDILKINNWLRE